MSSPQIEIQIIAALVAMACSLLGVFLVLRKTALISDAISHSILPGIVVGFFITEDLNSPFLILMAALTGMLTVLLIEWIQNTKLVGEDTSIGIVFPALFSLGIILIVRNAGDVHLDTDAVLLGELAFAPFDRYFINGVDYGPKAIWIMGGILLIIVTSLILFFKELKISTFDAGLASTLGFLPIAIHYGIMFLSSVTIVGAFDAVGAILVVGFIIVPAAMAYLLTQDLKKMLFLSVIISAVSAISGYWLAHALDASISGSIMAVMGFFFLIVYLFSPSDGIITRKINRKNQIDEISLVTLLIHIQNHESKIERNTHHLEEHINWKKEKAQRMLQMAEERNLIKTQNDIISVTPKGKEYSLNKIKYYLAE